MQAFSIGGYGQALQLTETSEPTVGDHDVLIDVRAASVNQLDIKIAEGEFKSLMSFDFPLTLGHDTAGTVIGAGSKVTRFAAGDRVFGRPRDGRIGTFAERIAVHENDLALVPTASTWEDAASLPLVALTAWQALVDVGKVQPGQRVLIHAGAGGVGSIAIQIAKHLGATVATTASARNEELVRSLGADIVIDYRSQDFESELSDYDFVLDGVGGESLQKSLRVLRPGGRAVGIAGPPTPEFARSIGANVIVKTAIAALSAKVRRQARKLDVNYDFLWMRASGQQLEQIATLVDRGVIRPLVGEVFSFDNTPAAVAALAAGGRAGKVVVRRE
ncbi:NADP-dependent oxidoreductase [Leucobacter sp. NPDC058333]|uniref:NADP-dependent oxidoreductase n=1 Tax=Leucobacter sp. NPDC058333 TaxID=3346450 RepID=UPI003667B2BA